jgi:hypothetical protein
MKNTVRTILLAILLVALLWPTTAFAKDPFDDQVVFGGTFTLESGETQQGSLVIFGGAVTTEPDSVVNGDLVLIGGTVEVGGTINGGVVGIGGAVRLAGSAKVNGDVFTLGATLRREEGASISGQVINGIETPLVTDEAQGNVQIPDAPQAPQGAVKSNPFLRMIWFFFRTFLYTALAVLLVMFLPTPVQRVSRAAVSQPVITAGAGLLTAILAPIALAAITLTLVLIPVTFVASGLIFAAWLLGWVALGLEVGDRIGKALKLDWAPAISAGVGTLVLLFVLGGFRELFPIPCIDLAPLVLVGIWGLGAVLMTGFGTQEYMLGQQPDEDQPGPAAPVAIPESLPPAFPDAEMEDDGAAGVDEETADSAAGAVAKVDEGSDGS